MRGLLGKDQGFVEEILESETVKNKIRIELWHLEIHPHALVYLCAPLCVFSFVFMSMVFCDMYHCGQSLSLDG